MTPGSPPWPSPHGSFPALFALVVGDAFLVVLPSETAVVALGALWATTGAPPAARIVPLAAAAGAVVGDGLCYLIGRRVGLDRWRWQREGRIGRRDRPGARDRAPPHRRARVHRAVRAVRADRGEPRRGRRARAAAPIPAAVVRGRRRVGDCTTSRSARSSAARSATARCSAIAISVPIAIVLGLARRPLDRRDRRPTVAEARRRARPAPPGAW